MHENLLGLLSFTQPIYTVVWENWGWLFGNIILLATPSWSLLWTTTVVHDSIAIYKGVTF